MLRHGGGISVTVAAPVLVASAWLVAVMVTVCRVAKLAGAVYSPLAALMLPAPAGALLQVTVWLAVLVTVAVNCCVCPPLIRMMAPGHTFTPIVLSPPMERKVAGELWLAYSAAIQSAERAILEIRTSSIPPLNVLARSVRAPM